MCPLGSARVELEGAQPQQRREPDRGSCTRVIGGGHEVLASPFGVGRGQQASLLEALLGRHGRQVELLGDGGDLVTEAGRLVLQAQVYEHLEAPHEDPDRRRCVAVREERHGLGGERERVTRQVEDRVPGRGLAEQLRPDQRVGHRVGIGQRLLEEAE